MQKDLKNIECWSCKKKGHLTFVLSAHKRRKGKSYDDQEKVVLVTTMALFANISDSWWIGSSHHIFFRKEEFGANMIEELGSSYMGNGTSTVIRGRGTV